MIEFAIENEAEAIADAWASIDGKLDKFRAGKGMRLEDEPGGHYSGYMAEAEEMINRLRARGYLVVHLIGEVDGPPLER
jgi:hypothetical protein